MTAQSSLTGWLDETQPAETPPAETQDDVFLTSADPVEAARQHLAETTLRADAGGRVGLELEHHLVDLADPGRRPTWDDVIALQEQLGDMPAGSSVTFEPGGQVELSTPPATGLVEAVTALRTDVTALRSQLHAAGYGAAALGSDLARAPRRINPHTRYLAMEEHFDALGFAGSGMEMMTATAALQVNLDAGPASGWQARVGLVRTMVPMLVAASSTSPWLGGRTSGWHSMRQGTWQGIDHGRSDPVPLGDPVNAWATYALEAPVMLVRDGDGAGPGHRADPVRPVAARSRPWPTALRPAAHDGGPRLPPDDPVPTRPSPWLPRAALPRRVARPLVARARGHHRDPRRRPGRGGHRGGPVRERDRQLGDRRTPRVGRRDHPPCGHRMCRGGPAPLPTSPEARGRGVRRAARCGFQPEPGAAPPRRDDRAARRTRGGSTWPQRLTPTATTCVSGRLAGSRRHAPAPWP